MARVTVDAAVFTDSRFDVLARELRTTRDSAVMRMIRVWVNCTDRETDRFSPRFLSPLLRCKADQVVAALCESAQLGEALDDGTVRIRGCAGRTDWLAKKRATAEAGGEARACSATRNADGTLANRDLRAEICDALDDRPVKRRELRRLLQVRRDALLREVRALLAAGEVVELDDGTLALAVIEPVDQPGSVPTEWVPGIDGTELEPVPGTPGTEAVPSALALAPAPALAPAHVSTSRVHAHAGSVTEPAQNREPGIGEPVGNREPGTQDSVEPQPTEPESSLESQKPVTRAERRPMARRLWVYQAALRRRLDANAPDLPIQELPGGALDAVIQRLAHYPPEVCKHALDIFAVEGECIRDEGGDPLEFLNGRTNWKREQFERAMATTADAVRKRYQRRRKADQRNPPDDANRSMTRL